MKTAVLVKSDAPVNFETCFGAGQEERTRQLAAPEAHFRMNLTTPSLLSPHTLLSLALMALIGLTTRDVAAQAPITASEDPGQWALIYSEVLNKNRDRLKDYSWQYRVEVEENGEMLYVDHLSARYGDDGLVETFRIEQELRVKERHGLLLKAGQELRLGEVEKKIEILKKYLGDYVYMTPGQIVDFFEKARKSEAVGYDNALRLDAENVLNEGDSVTLFGDKSSAYPIFIAFSLPLDAATGIRCEVHFRHLRQLGAFYGSKVSGEFVDLSPVLSPKTITVHVESFDYVAKP